MYNPFVRACNYALDALSRVNDVEGLPEVSKQMEIVFARNYEVVESGHPMWESQGQPGIVLMGWDKFKRVRDLPDETPYSQSYNGDICVSNPGPDTWFYWPEIRSTVELKITGLPKDKWTRDFEAGFKDLAELEPHISLEDPPQDVFSPEPVRRNICKCASPGRFRSLICPRQMVPRARRAWTRLRSPRGRMNRFSQPIRSARIEQRFRMKTIRRRPRSEAGPAIGVTRRVRRRTRKTAGRVLQEVPFVEGFR